MMQMLKEPPLKVIDKPEMCVCSVCGYLVPDKDIMLEMEAVYSRRRPWSMGRWHLAICSACTHEMDEIDKGGAEAAMIRTGVKDDRNHL